MAERIHVSSGAMRHGKNWKLGCDLSRASIFSAEELVSARHSEYEWADIKTAVRIAPTMGWSLLYTLQKMYLFDTGRGGMDSGYINDVPKQTWLGTVSMKPFHVAPHQMLLQEILNVSSNCRCVFEPILEEGEAMAKGKIIKTTAEWLQAARESLAYWLRAQATLEAHAGEEITESRGGHIGTSAWEINHSGSQCALCAVKRSCQLCPIAIDTNHGHCDETPYIGYRELAEFATTVSSELRAAHRAEVEYLSGLVDRCVVEVVRAPEAEKRYYAGQTFQVHLAGVTLLRLLILRDLQYYLVSVNRGCVGRWGMMPVDQSGITMNEIQTRDGCYESITPLAGEWRFHEEAAAAPIEVDQTASLRSGDHVSTADGEEWLVCRVGSSHSAYRLSTGERHRMAFCVGPKALRRLLGRDVVVVYRAPDEEAPDGSD